MIRWRIDAALRGGELRQVIDNNGSEGVSEWVTGWLTKFNSLSRTFNPYKPCKHNLFMGIVILPYVDKNNV